MLYDDLNILPDLAPASARCADCHHRSWPARRLRSNAASGRTDSRACANRQARRAGRHSCQRESDNGAST